MNIDQINEGMKIKYIGESWAYGGKYTVISAESTYGNVEDCPIDEKGKLMIVEFTNNDTPMFLQVDRLSPNEWIVVEG